MTTALSPCRSCWATPLVFAAESTHVSIGPPGPTRVADAPLAASGIIAMIGRPAAPVQLQKFNGVGDSAMKRLRFVVVPSPGKRIGKEGRGDEPRPRITSRVAPLCQVGVESRSHFPKPVRCRLGRNTPIAWNGPVLHSSTWLRALVLIWLETATLPLLPARSPSGVWPRQPGPAPCEIPLNSM